MSNWWCQYCNSVVQPEHVTYEETHDPRTGGCGGVVHGGYSAPTGELVGRIAEQDKYIALLKARIHEAKEIYIGMEGFVPETAPEAYQKRALDQIWEALQGQEK